MTVTGTAYPADAVAGSPTYTALMGRNAFSAAMAGATSTNPLGGITGVRPGTSPATIGIVSQTVWSIAKPFSGYIDLENSTTNSGYFFTAPVNASAGTIAAAAGSARIDLIYVQINDSNTGDGSTGAPRVTVDYQQGVAGSGVAPGLPLRAFAIAQINVPASGGGLPTVTWIAPNTVAAGGILPVPTWVLLNGITGTSGQYATVYADTATYNGLYFWNGTVWQQYGVKRTPQIVTGAGLAAGALMATTVIQQRASTQTILVQITGTHQGNVAGTAAIGISVGAGGTLVTSGTQLVPIATTRGLYATYAQVTVAAGSGTATISYILALGTTTSYAFDGLVYIDTTAP